MQKSSQKAIFSSDKNYWETPKWLYNELDKEFHFTLDAAASDENHKCDHYFTAENDGLKQNWEGHTVFVNPPYGNKETGEWTRKCYEEAQKLDTTVVLLIPHVPTERVFTITYMMPSNTKLDPALKFVFCPGD